MGLPQSLRLDLLNIGRESHVHRDLVRVCSGDAPLFDRTCISNICPASSYGYRSIDATDKQRFGDHCSLAYFGFGLRTADDTDGAADGIE